jgi:nucleoside-diphosphate-sugar epimerase
MSPGIEKVVVTGGVGRLGQVAVQQLLDAGYDVTSVDVMSWPSAPCEHLQADLTELGQCIEVLDGASAVVHLAGIFGAGIRTSEVTFRINVQSIYNVFQAATALHLKRVVWASTSAVAGAPFGETVPPSLPITEDTPFNTSTSYALSKALGEVMAKNRRLWGNLSFTALRFAWIFTPPDYAEVPAFWPDVNTRKFNLWAYLDVRDAAAACQRAIEANRPGAEAYFITAADTLMMRPSRDLAAECFPGVSAEGLSGHSTFFSIQKASRELGWEPRHSWRAYVKEALPEGER